MEIVIADDVQAQEQQDATRQGMTVRKWLLTGEADDGLAFRLFRSQYQQGEKAFQSPRHHHGFQQIRWAEAGSINYGPEQNIPEGDIAYFPRGTYYGPQLKDQGISMLLQFGFGPELLGGKNAIATGRAAMERLRERGAIEDGVFIDSDPATGAERRRDVAEVVAEEVTGSRYTVPAEGYETPILMHPDAFDFFGLAPGVEVKHLGGFYDQSGPAADLRISVLRLGDRASHLLGEERAYIAWTTSAGLSIDGRTYPRLTCFYSPRGEAMTLSSDGGVEVYLIAMPRLD